MLDIPDPAPASALSEVFFDNQPVALAGEAAPQVLEVVRAVGARPSELEIIRVPSAASTSGTHLHLEDILDRKADPVNPIYLISRERRSVLRSEGRVRRAQPMGRIPPQSPDPAPGDALTRSWAPTDPEWKF
ncbi:MAG: hypothetical protein V4510_06290 [bacterium]